MIRQNDCDWVGHDLLFTLLLTVVFEVGLVLQYDTFRCIQATEMRRWDAGRCWRQEHGEMLLLLLLLTMMTFSCQGISTKNVDVYRRTATNAAGKFEPSRPDSTIAICC